MGEKTQLGVWTIVVALVLGVAGDYLLRGVPWGLNVTLLIVALVGLVAYPVWRGKSSGPLGRWSLLFGLFALTMAVCIVLRASPVVITLNVLGCLLALTLIVAAWQWNAGPRGILEAMFQSVSAGILSFSGPVPVMVKDVSWSEVAPGGWRTPVLSVLRGVFIAVPLLLIFGALLVAADAVFQRVISDIFDFDIADVVGHIALVLFLFWLACGYLYLALFNGGVIAVDVPRPRWLLLGLLETTVILGSLNVLFLSFVVVQAGYLFGAQPQVAADLTYSEYARRGFFELVAVAALVIPLLLTLHWLMRRDSSRNLVVFRLLAGTMVLLVFVMMASAMWRMYLYFVEFGLTELRFYTSAFMIWLGVVLVLYLVFVLRERRNRFAGFTIISGFVAILAINAANPDAVIARSNIERYLDGRELDAYYLTELSEDAAPVIFASLPETGDERIAPTSVSYDEEGEIVQTESPTLEEEAITRWKGDEDSDWRSWNISRARAAALAADISP